jgi:phage virion morphogenesis protein
MALIVIEVDDKAVIQAMDRLAKFSGDPGPVLKAIGEDLVASTKERFGAGKGPDGTPWSPNSPVTIARYLQRRRGGKKPLIGESRALSTTIGYTVAGSELVVGSPMKYAAVQQLGAAKGSLGKRAPWGDIPPRPYLGISGEDQERISRTILDYLTVL